MGLDMYLSAIKKVEGYTFDEMRDFARKIESDDFDLDSLPEAIRRNVITKGSSFQWDSLYHDAVYWRKVNAVHDWFVQNVQGGEDDCGLYRVYLEDLEELISTCLKVLDDPELAEDKLPPVSGFFFGSTEIDEYYMEDLKETVTELEEALRNFPSDEYYYAYQSSW